MLNHFQKIVFLFGCVAFVVALSCTCLPNLRPEPRISLYLKQETIRTFYEPKTNTVNSSETAKKLGEAIDKRLGFYASLLADLRVNRYGVAIVGGLSALLIISKKPGFKMPWIDHEVPRRMALRILPLLCLFLWLDFGYNLNACLDARITAMQLINASLAIDGHNQFTGDEFQRAHYTLTRSSELEDHGLIDSWFWNFLHSPDTLVMARRGWYNWIIPVIAILWYAALYGLLHAATFYLPTRDVDQYSHRPTIYAWAIVVLSIIVISFSHASFYYAGRHFNWFQLATLGFSLCFYYLFSRRDPRINDRSAKEGKAQAIVSKS